MLLSPGGERVIERWEAGAGAPAPPADLLLRRFLSDATYQRIATLRQATTPTLTLTVTLTLALPLRYPNPNPNPKPNRTLTLALTPTLTLILTLALTLNLKLRQEDAARRDEHALTNEHAPRARAASAAEWVRRRG